MLIKKIFKVKWILTFIFVIAGILLCVRLGFWQLDRLAQKKEFISHYSRVTNLPPLIINSNLDQNNLEEMDYRKIAVIGTFDSNNSFVLRNQYHDGKPGYFLLTPLKLSEKLGVLVERGWIPAEDNESPEKWHQYDMPQSVKITGILRLGNNAPEIVGILNKNGQQFPNKLLFLNNISTDEIGSQLPYKILPIFIQPEISAKNSNPPFPYQPEIDLSEGPHFGYALQWFTFAAILFLGFPFFIDRQLKNSEINN